MKPQHFKPGLYAIFFEQLKLIARDYGYELVIHGSMSRDLDLIAIPWVDDPQPEQALIGEFQTYLRGKMSVNPEGNIPFTVLPGNRHAYTISLNRGNRHGEWVRFEDSEYYLDISVLQVAKVDEPGKEQMLYAFIYNPDIHDSTYATVSTHLTRKGAEMALEYHRAERLKEYADGEFKIEQFEGFDIREITVEP